MALRLKVVPLADAPKAVLRLTLPSSAHGASGMRALFARRREVEGYAVLAEKRGALVGWAAVFRTGKARASLYVFVDPAYRGAGIGTALVERARRVAQRRLGARRVRDFLDGSLGAALEEALGGLC